jgi:hypothetical protein
VRIVLAYDSGSLRRWHLWLAEALGRQHEIALSGLELVRPWPKSLALLQSLERLIYRQPDMSASDFCDSDAPLNTVAASDIARGGFDLLIDVTAGMRAAIPGLRTIAPLFSGVPDELAAADALLNGALVNLSIYDSAEQLPLWQGRSAAEDRKILSKALDNAFCRAGTLLAKAADRAPGVSDDEQSRRKSPHRPYARSGSEITHLAASVPAKAASLLKKLCGRGHEWGIAWRQTRDALSGYPSNTELTFQRIANNAGSYFADPFILARDGRHYLFAEEYFYDSDRGVISVMEIEDGRTVGPSKIVLDRPYHLSYPFVFERGGEIYMMPETGAANRVEVYRAERFPDRWTLHATLIDNVAAYDATLCEHDGRQWLFMTTGGWQSSTWDTLEIYHSDRLEGTWTPLADNPVFIDPDGARPGGAMYQSEGALWRPAQDCSEIYGGGLALCRVDDLSLQGFRQTVVSHLVPASRSISGVHTLNSANGIETVDIFASRSAEPAKLIVKSVV